MKIQKILEYASYAMFILAGVMVYAHVYDIEPHNPYDEYTLERDHFNRNGGDWYRDFPTYGEWMNEQDRKEERLHEWLSAAFRSVMDDPDCFDIYTPLKEKYWSDPREGQGACAPDNWARGERE